MNFAVWGHIAYFGRNHIVLLVMCCWHRHASTSTPLWRYWLELQNNSPFGSLDNDQIWRRHTCKLLMNKVMVVLCTNIVKYTTKYHIFRIQKIQNKNYDVSTLRPRQNGHKFPDDIFKCIFLNENIHFWLRIHWSLFPRIQSTVFQHWFIWWLGTVPGDKP